MTEPGASESLPVCATCGAATPIVEIGGVRWHTHGGYLMYRCDEAALDAAERAYWQDDGVSRHNLAAAIRAYLAGSCPPAPSPTDSEIVEFVCEAYNAGRFDGDAAAVKFVREWLGLDRWSPRPTGESGAGVAEAGR